MSDNKFPAPRRSPQGPSRQHRRGSQTLLVLTMGSAVAQFLAGGRNMTHDGPFGVVFHGAHGVVWMATALRQLLLLLLVPPAAAADPPPLGANGRSSSSSKPHAALSVAASMLLMAAALSCLGGVVAARFAVLRHLLASAGLGLLCLSRAEFQRPHDGAAAADMDRYGGGFLLLSSVLAFRMAWRASPPCTRVTAGGQQL